MSGIQSLHQVPRKTEAPWLEGSALAALALLSAVTAFAAGSAPPATASGTFEDARFKLEIGGAYAYWGKTGGFGDDPVIRVAVSNAGVQGFVPRRLLRQGRRDPLALSRTRTPRS